MRKKTRNPVDDLEQAREAEVAELERLKRQTAEVRRRIRLIDRAIKALDGVEFGQ